MRRIAATTTITALFSVGWVPSSSAAEGSMAKLIEERRFVADGFEVELAVTENADGPLSEATVVELQGSDEVDVWTDGSTVWWAGIVEGEPLEGSAPAERFVDWDQPQAHICLTPVGAIVCIGAAAVLLAGCSYGFSCDGGTPPTNPPGSSGGGGDGEPEHEDEGDGGSGRNE